MMYHAESSSGIGTGVMLPRCEDTSPVAFLPWVLLHAPEPPRVFTQDDLWADAGSVRMADILIAGILAHQPRQGHLPAAARLADLGKHLRWLGSLSLTEFEARLGSVQRYVTFLEDPRGVLRRSSVDVLWIIPRLM